MKQPASDVLVGEIASVLNECAYLICTPHVEEDDGVITLTVRIDPYVQPTTGNELAAVEMGAGLRRVTDVGTLRAIARAYDIDPQQIERLLSLKEEN